MPNYIEDEEQHLLQNEYLDRPISENEVLVAIKNLKTGKSPGIDGLISQFFKSCPEQICPYLTTLLNSCLNMVIFLQNGRLQL